MRIKVEDFDLNSILFSGACFRAVLEEDGSITNILKDRVINIKQDGNYLIVESSKYEDLENVIKDYFDLNRDYDEINNSLVLENPELNDMVLKCKSYRILNQDSFEMCISYIISQNNNVKRISKSIDMLCQKYGKKINFKNKDYYLFPTYEELVNIDSDTLKEFGVGFRDKYIIDFISKYPLMKDINKLSTEESLAELMNVKGIGMKVASCILLFGYKRLDVFPIDTWVRQYMVSHYDVVDNQKEIEKFTKNKFREYSGLVIQYMFHSQRNI